MVAEGGCFVVFCQLTEVYMGAREGKSFHSWLTPVVHLVLILWLDHATDCCLFSWNKQCHIRLLALIQAIFHVSDRFWARENHRPKKLKNNFSPKEILFFKGSYTLLFILTYIVPWRAAELCVFIHFTFTNLPWCSQMYTLYRSQLLFMSAWSQSWSHFFVLPPPKKNILYNPLDYKGT